MVTQISRGIRVTVSTIYQSDFSAPEKNHHLFSYHVTIENNCDYSVKLMRRHWFIFDSCGHYNEVEGEGVIGEQPELEPGQIYEYESGCNLLTDIGKMNGHYIMQRMFDSSEFMIDIPEFELIAPNRLN